MMLQNSFFYFTGPITEGDFITSTIELNADHPIFKGHFPDQPIVPGVCMMQMVKEILEKYSNKTLQLVKANDLKFLSFVDPGQNLNILMKFKIKTEENLYRIDAQLLDNETVLFKFKGGFAEKLDDAVGSVN